MKLRFKFESTDSLVRRTVIMTGALVGACVAVVGSLTAIALLVTSHAVGPATNKDSSATPSTDTPAPVPPAKRSAARTPT